MGDMGGGERTISTSYLISFEFTYDPMLLSVFYFKYIHVCIN